MTTLNDAVVLATGGPTYNDGLATFFGKTEDETLNDAIRRVLAAQPGVTSSNLNTMWMQFLTGEGYTGTLNDMQFQFWENYDGNPPIPTKFFELYGNFEGNNGFLTGYGAPVGAPGGYTFDMFIHRDTIGYKGIIGAAWLRSIFNTGFNFGQDVFATSNPNIMTFLPNTLYHIEVSWNGVDQQQVDINGTVYPLLSDYVNSGLPMQIGNAGAGDNLNGGIINLQIYDDFALTNLIHSYPMNEGTGDTFFDAVGLLDAVCSIKLNNAGKWVEQGQPLPPDIIDCECAVVALITKPNYFGWRLADGSAGSFQPEEFANAPITEFSTIDPGGPFTIVAINDASVLSMTTETPSAGVVSDWVFNTNRWTSGSAALKAEIIAAVDGAPLPVTITLNYVEVAAVSIDIDAMVVWLISEGWNASNSGTHLQVADTGESWHQDDLNVCNVVSAVNALTVDLHQGITMQGVTCP